LKQLPRALGFPCLPCFLSATFQYSLESEYAAAESGCGSGLVFEIYQSLHHHEPLWVLLELQQESIAVAVPLKLQPEPRL
jgi:hypothetical protein